MNHTSIVQARGNVAFPAYTGERVYMREFTKRAGLPPDLRRWQRTVDAMLDGVDTDGPIYLMVDQGFVPAGATHRRAGVHVDGYWHAAVQAHGGFGSVGGGHGFDTPSRGTHGGTPARDPSSHKFIPSAPTTRRVPRGKEPEDPYIVWPDPLNEREDESQDDRDRPETQSDILFDSTGAEGLILATDITACRGFAGRWAGNPRAGGDCDHIDLSTTTPIMLHDHVVYAGNVAMLHEALPVPHDCLRTVVRLNVPGWTPKA